MLYVVNVTEIIHQPRTYTVEAASIEEAREKASIGDTVEEEDEGSPSVHDRIIEEDPVEVNPDLCAACRVDEHPQCPLTDGCRCCDDTRAGMLGVR